MHVALSAANIPAATRRATPKLPPARPRRFSKGACPASEIVSQRRLRPGNVVDRVKCPYPRAPVESLAPTLTPSLADTLSPQATARPSLVRAARHVAMPSAAVDPDATAVLFDFDGTLGDTETPAMRVAFWELAPYLPDASPDNLTVATRDAYVRDNAGKAFEFMVDVVEADRKAAGLPSVEETRASAAEDPAVLAPSTPRAKNPGSPSRTPARSGRTFSPCRRTRPWMRSPRSPIRARASPTCSRA